MIETISPQLPVERRRTAPARLLREKPAPKIFLTELPRRPETPRTAIATLDEQLRPSPWQSGRILQKVGKP